MSKLYTILLSSDLKTKKVRHQHQHPNKKKVSALKIQILIKYKRIKWTPISIALRRKTRTIYHIIFKRFKEPKSGPPPTLKIKK